MRQAALHNGLVISAVQGEEEGEGEEDENQGGEEPCGAGGALAELGSGGLAALEAAGAAVAYQTCKGQSDGLNVPDRCRSL